MRNTTKWVIGGSGVLGVAAIVTAGASAAPARPAVAPIRLSSVSAPTGAAAADQAAVSYVTTHDPGAGTANVLATSPDVEHGVAVYDIRIQAPSGTTYVVHVQQSNDGVLSVNLAEKQVTAPVTTPPVTTQPVTTLTPRREPVQPTEPKQAPSTSGNSVDTQAASSPPETSVDTQAASTSGKSVDTQAPSSSPDKSPDHHDGSPDQAKPATQRNDG